MKQLKLKPILDNKGRKDKRITVRYQENSDIGLIIDYLTNNQENVSEFLRELLIITKGVNEREQTDSGFNLAALNKFLPEA
jgi:hypothetical protein